MLTSTPTPTPRLPARLDVARRRRPARWSLALAAVCWLAPSFALAARPTFDVGVFAGHQIVSSETELGNALYEGNTPDSGALVGLRIGLTLAPMLAVEAEAKVLPTSYRRGGESATVLGWRANVLAMWPMLRGRLRPFALVGYGGETLLEGKEGVDSGDRAERDTDLALHLGVGAKFRALRYLGLRADVRYLNVPSRGVADTTYSLEFHLGVELNIGARAPDADGDGLPDATDRCPSQAEDKDGFQDADGCPDLDNDGDGVPDAADKCPNEAEDRDGFQDEDGCPDPDNDGDGIPDGVDRCPNKAEDKDGHQDNDGCPDPDNDGDGIPDTADKCRDQAETRNGWQDDDGCPDTVPAPVRASFHGKLEGIFFRTGSAVIIPTSYPVLNEALKILTQYPALRIEISGHTDTSGDYEANVKLSTARAQAVKSWFVEGGVDGARMVARGYGPDRPMYKNDTKDNRALNRRIEMHLLSPANGVDRVRPRKGKSATEGGESKNGKRGPAVF